MSEEKKKKQEEYSEHYSYKSESTDSLKTPGIREMAEQLGGIDKKDVEKKRVETL